MAMQTITGLFDTPAQARQAVADLEAAGVPHADISIVSNNADSSWPAGRDADADADDTTSGAGTGGSIGAVLGGGAGLLAGLGMLAIPGLGPVVAAGWLAATAVGAVAGGVAGGLVGALTDAGVSTEHAHVYAEGVRRGGSLVTVKTDGQHAVSAQSILARNGAVNPDERRTAYASSGWTGFDEAAPAYSNDQIDAERDRYGNGAGLR